MNRRPASERAEELDVFACPLDGVNQIEASAGTGKTWNICALYVRLLLEKKLAADQILVVTFTKAATAELHERIRSRLAELAHAIETATPRAIRSSSAFSKRRSPTSITDEALKRIHIALHTFDQAAIHTIHAFCQRALQEAPFAAAMPFALEMEADDSALRFETGRRFLARARRAGGGARALVRVVARGEGRGTGVARCATRAAPEEAARRAALGRSGRGGIGGRASDLRYRVRAVARRARRHREPAARGRSEARARRRTSAR